MQFYIHRYTKIQLDEFVWFQGTMDSFWNILQFPLE